MMYRLATILTDRQTYGQTTLSHQ